MCMDRTMRRLWFCILTKSAVFSSSNNCRMKQIIHAANHPLSVEDALYQKCGLPEKTGSDYTDEREDYGTF